MVRGLAARARALTKEQHQEIAGTAAAAGFVKDFV